MTYKAITKNIGVPLTTVKDICDAMFSKQSANNPKIEEKRRKKSLITPKDVKKMEKILEENGFNF